MKITIFILLLFVFACTQEKQNSVEKQNTDSVEYVASYIQLNVGNYWVYETVSIDTSGAETFVRVDSVFINSDTLINGNSYFEYVEAPAFGTTDTVIRFFRDSLGYLIDTKGTILFSESNFSDTLRQIIDTGLFSINYIMTKGGEISVPAGRFSNCLCYKGQVRIEPLFDSWEHPDSHNNFYGPGVGKVKSTAFFISKPIVLERRLLRYKIND